MLYHRSIALPTLPFTVLDTETTGFTPKLNHIIEFASVRVEGGTMVDEYEQLFSIPTGIPDVVQALTRIKPEDLEGKPTFSTEQASVEQHIGANTLIVGQNVSFDINMLRGDGIDISDRPWIDTSMLTSLVFPELESYSLGYVSTALNLNHEPVHRALGDVHATLELLEKCWDRLLELPEELLSIARTIMSRSSTGYQLLFDALPKSTATSVPDWLQMPRNKPPRLMEGLKAGKNIPKPDIGTVQLMEESLDPQTLEGVIGHALQKEHSTWLVVKNLGQTLERFTIPSEVQSLWPERCLLQRRSVEALASQKQYTADEATLAIKLAWYEPSTIRDIPLHGGEKAIWNSKISCTDSASEYEEQFRNPSNVVLLDHQHLLRMLAQTSHPGHRLLRNTLPHVILDDASMLEDTATKAFGAFVALSDMRAGAEGNAELTRLLDRLQIWLEQVRQGQDTHHFTAAELTGSDLEQVVQQLQSQLYQVSAALQKDVSAMIQIFDPVRLKGNIAWGETRQDGSQFLQAAPERIGSVLQEHLYDCLPITLLIPPQSRTTLTELLPRMSTFTEESLNQPDWSVPLAFPADANINSLLENPPPGKTVMLVGSKRIIEDMFVKHSEALEKQGVTCIFQSMSGGMGRMQATFLRSNDTTVWLMTPWSFEGVQLEAGCIDHLVLHSLPFDHPNHAVLSKRAEHYENAFMEYSFPRLKHRLFRLLRTFCLYRSQDADVQVLDERVRTKRYGQEVKQYLMDICGANEEDSTSPAIEQTPDVVQEQKPQPVAEESESAPDPKAILEAITKNQKKDTEDHQIAMF